MSGEPGWAIPWTDDKTGVEYTLIWKGIESLTVSRLRAFKNWYGPDFGKAYSFNLSFLQADCDAVACVIWSLLMEKRKTDPTITVYDNPNMLPDFSVGSLAANTVHEPDPTLVVEPELSVSDLSMTPDSLPILTNSEVKPLEGSRSTGARRKSPTS
jgi:hypothetical protein